MYPLVRIEEVTSTTDPELVSSCITAFIKPELVKGKIIICPELSDIYLDRNLHHLGCAGVIFDGAPDKYYFDWFKDLLNKRPVRPLTVLRGQDFKYLEQYYNKSVSTG